MYCDNIYTSPLIYSASGAVVSKTIKGCPPKRANKIPPTDCEMITFWTSVKEWWVEQSTSKSSLKNVTCKSQSMTTKCKLIDVGHSSGYKSHCKFCNAMQQTLCASER